MHEVLRPSRRDEQRIIEWQFLLLRFAITREPFDLAAAAAAAKSLDAVIAQRTASFSYFTRTTSEIGAAIAGTPDAPTRLTLRRFAARIDDRRLRAAFSACLDLPADQAARPRPRAAWRDGLWRGLAKR